MVLYACPAKNGEDYWTRKKQHALAAMIVCDDRKVIRYAHCGFTGSGNDSRVYKNSKTERHATDFFTGPEYLLSDSEYSCIKRVIAVYKKPPSLDLAFRVKKFNTLLSKIRVNVRFAQKC